MMRMNRKFSLPIFALTLLFLAASCGKKSEDMTPVQPGETVTYKDQVYKFSFKAPKAWVAESTPGQKTAYYSTQGAETRFSKFTEGDYGAKIEVGAAEGKTKEQAMEDFKQNISGLVFKNPEQTTLGGQPAVKLAYTVEGSDPDGYEGYRIFTDKDSVMTYFEATTFGDKRMSKYKPVFDLAEKSVVPGFVLRATGGKIDSASEARLMEEAKPSETFATYNGSGYSIDYPNNFNVRASSRGVLIKGDRQDATLQVDILDAGGAESLDKFVSENAQKTYKGAAVSNASVGGQAGKAINYSLVSGTQSRAYFVMRGKNVYRITINWPTSLDAAYRPSLEKAASSFHLK